MGGSRGWRGTMALAPTQTPQCSGGVASISLCLTTVSQERLKIAKAEFPAQQKSLKLRAAT